MRSPDADVIGQGSCAHASRGRALPAGQRLALQASSASIEGCRRLEAHRSMRGRERLTGNEEAGQEMSSAPPQWILCGGGDEVGRDQKGVDVAVASAGGGGRAAGAGRSGDGSRMGAD
jgi:hypothetical protein